MIPVHVLIFDRLYIPLSILEKVFFKLHIIHIFTQTVSHSGPELINRYRVEYRMIIGSTEIK